MDKGAVGLAGQPLVALAGQLGGGDKAPIGVKVVARVHAVHADVAMEAAARQRQLVRISARSQQALDGAVPLIDGALAVLHVLVAQHLVHGVAHRHVLLD